MLAQIPCSSSSITQGGGERGGKLRDIIASYQDKPGGIIEAYHALQEEFNYIPREAIDEVARVFGVSEAQAYGVATFIPTCR